MNIKYTECPRPRKTPCLMKNEFDEVFLVTDKSDGKGFYVTRINCDAEDVETWESDLKDYKPLPKGTKVELIN